MTSHAYFKKSKPLKNYDCAGDKLNSGKSPMAPKTPCRILICGPSGAGKTNLLLNLVYDMLRWDNLYLYAKDLLEAKYQSLRDACELASKCGKKPFRFEFSSDEIVDVDELDPLAQNLIVFDDFLMDASNMSKIANLFIRGRKRGATVIMLTQSYYATPKLIRLQCNHFCIFRPRDDREIGELHKNHGCGLPRQEFLKMFYEATSAPYSFFYLDLDNPDPSLACRQNFNGVRKNY